MPVLQLIKAHLISLLCGVCVVAFVVFGVLGMSSDAVVKDMQQVVQNTEAASIRGLKSNPTNEALIAKKKEEGELFDSEYEKTLAVAKTINRREVLMKGVFPQPEKAATPFEFKELYKRAATVELPRYADLEAGKLPDQAEFDEEAQNVQELREREQERLAEEQAEEGGRTPRVTPGSLTRAVPYPGPSPYPGPMAPPEEVTGAGIRSAGGPRRMAGPGGPGLPAPAAPTDEPKYNAFYRARVAKAKSILCYYDDSTFHVSPLAYQEAAPSPAPEEMWYAQVGLWVQQDVVTAIAALNHRAADKVSDVDACVEDVPVKRIVMLRVLGYEAPPPTGRVPFNAAEGMVGVNLSPSVGAPSFTGRRCNEQFDIVRFVLVVVVDQRELLQLVNEISRVNFYECINAGYEAVDRATEENLGYFYGTDPVVRATLEFEGYMARQLYQDLMPPAVRKLLGIESE